MKKHLILSILCVTSGLSVNPIYANEKKCQPEYVASVLQRGILDEGDFLVPERRYGLQINKKKIGYNKEIESLLTNAQIENIGTQWNSSADPLEEFCEVQITDENGKVTEAKLFPYTYTKPQE